MRGPHLFLPVVFLLAVISLLPGEAHGQAAADACGPAIGARPPGVVWQARGPLGLREIASLLAPMLWFSADEPLLAEGQPPIPTAHPCDIAAGGAVV